MAVPQRVARASGAAWALRVAHSAACLLGMPDTGPCLRGDDCVHPLPGSCGKADRVPHLPSAFLPGRQAFSALTFPTICGRCNSELLGSKYDPELQRFCNLMALSVRSRFAAGLELGKKIEVKTRPARLVRALIGHLLSAEHRPDPWADLV